MQNGTTTAYDYSTRTLLVFDIDNLNNSNHDEVTGFSYFRFYVYLCRRVYAKCFNQLGDNL